MICNRKIIFDHFCYRYFSACMFQNTSFVFINTKSCSKIWLCLRNRENDKGLYATMNRWRIDPSSCLDTCWVDDMAVWWFRATCFHGLKYLCVNREVLKQNRYENRNESIKRVFVPYRCILDYLWYGMAILYLIKYGNPNFSRNFSPVFFAFSK